MTAHDGIHYLLQIQVKTPLERLHLTFETYQVFMKWLFLTPCFHPLSYIPNG